MTKEVEKKLKKIAKGTKMEEEILEHLKVIRRRIFIMSVLAWVKAIVIVAPIIFALIWLPPKIEKLGEDYDNYKGQVDDVLGGKSGIDGLFEQFFGK